ncbi:MAG: PT domain-containing protein, partial [Yaniella sp.]|uniref:PT domain-containing protein n=1 Tax=Yaniella sp. TaxID=2773929 RepID=UPI003F96E13B
TDEPTEDPTDEPTDEPTEDPTDEPTDEPTEDPTDEPTDEPTEDPTDEPTDEPTKDPTDEQLEIDLETSTVYPGESLEISGAGFTPEGTVGLSWNPTAQTTADTDGNISAEMTIPEDAEPGSETLTVVDEVSGGKATVDFTVLEPSMTIDPQEIALDDFVGDPEDDAGVDHTVQGAAPGSKITYVVTGPAGVNDFESTAVVNGSAEFVIFAPEISNPSVYLGDYNTVVTYENAAGETEELQGSFTVVDGSGSSGSNDSDDQADPVVDTGDPVDMNGSDNLAQTGASNAQLGLLAGLLLAVGGAFVVYSNRARLFPRKK